MNAPQPETLEHRAAVRLQSGAPWDLSLSIESSGDELVCRLQNARNDAGAVAVAEWRAGAARIVGRTVDGHREIELAEYTARRLCRGARVNVTCLSRVRFDGLSKREADELVFATQRLAMRAERTLADARVSAELKQARLASRLESALTARVPQVEDFLSRPLPSLLSDMRPVLERLRACHFHDEVRLFAPLYLANACLNDCAYCGFRKSASTSRVRLSVDEALEEARALADAGHRALDLVTGEIPHDPFVDYVCRVVERIRADTPIEHIHLNLGALSTDQFRRLHEAGARGYHLYQETYSPEIYRAVHRSGPKREMAHRLEAPERALDAGFRALGLGVLLGLAPVSRELAALVEHAHSLVARTPDLMLGFSLPRLQAVDAECTYQAAAPVDDETFVKSLVYLRLEFPSAHLTLTTRESPELRDALVPLLVTKLSAGVSTAPGGYASEHGHAAPQFSIRDSRSLDEVIAIVRRAGLRPMLGSVDADQAKRIATATPMLQSAV